jgi:hypothetical protein
MVVRMRVFAYILSASDNPDYIRCNVPYEINEDLIFFGPCKKRLREHFYKQYLKNSLDDEIDITSENIYIIGLNGSNRKRKRKIVWIGKVLKILTFEKAYNTFSKDSRFKKMMDEEDSPLHLKPIYNNKGIFIGYKLRSTMHEKNNEWILDIITRRDNSNVKLEGKSLILKDPSKRKETFVRDCAFCCKNIFYANGKGIDIDDKILEIFKKSQGQINIDSYAIFGYRNDGSAEGLAGRYLEINNNEGLAKELIEYVCQKSNNYHNNPQPKIKKPPVKKCRCK